MLPVGLQVTPVHAFLSALLYTWLSGSHSLTVLVTVWFAPPQAWELFWPHPLKWLLCATVCRVAWIQLESLLSVRL